MLYIIQFMSSGKILLGVLAGFAAGVAVGILFAPDKGTETRRKVIQKGDEYLEDLKKKFDEILNDVSQKFESDQAAKEEVVNEAAE